ncbi:bcl-2 homologous antagonist/killer-like isoform X1 [Oscarella lobularis]
MEDDLGVHDLQQQIAAENLFRAFVKARQPQETEEDIQRALEEAEKIQQETSSSSAATSPIVESRVEIADRLVNIADEIDSRYHDEFEEMVERLRLTPENAYGSFSELAMRLLRRGVNWGNIIALFVLGYRIVKKFAASVTKIVGWVAGIIGRFVVREKIAQWVQEHGGWGSVLSLGAADLFPGSRRTVFYLFGAAVVAAGLLYLSRK